MFIDEAKIYVKAGDGGSGVNSFYRDKYTRRGKPDGGNGGKGGDIIIECDENIQTLLDFQFKQHFRARNGSHGSGKKKNGRDGANCIIRVPVGTVIRDCSTHFLIRDLAKINEKVIVAKGGNGGKGNSGLRLATLEIPNYRRKAKFLMGLATKGDKGEEKRLSLELKLIADVGIIGFPNVGKSTLISSISNARPKIANYPFTTKSPILGIVIREDKNFKVADIPGLIEGSHRGKGLGDKFLRHIERTRLLVHIVDIAAVEGRNPVEDYHSLNRELRFYSTKLKEKPQIIAANKMDLPGAQENLERFKAKLRKEIFPISALTGEGLEELIETISKRL
jgi:GTP-binding protein